MPPRLFHLLFLSCKRATLLLEKQRYVSLTRYERWRLQRHMRVCLNCKAYHHQFSLIDQGLETLSNQEGFDKIIDLDLNEYKRRLKDCVRSAGK